MHADRGPEDQAIPAVSSVAGDLQIAELLKVREGQLRNAVMLMLRLARCLPREHKVREQAMGYLAQEGLMPSVLRDAPSHLQLGAVPSQPPVTAKGTQYAADITDEMRLLVENGKAVARMQSEAERIAKGTGEQSDGWQDAIREQLQESLAERQQLEIVLETFRRDHEAMEAVRKHGLDLFSYDDTASFSAHQQIEGKTLFESEEFHDPADAVFDLVGKLEGK